MAGRGIGAATGRLFAEEGARVARVGFTADPSREDEARRAVTEAVSAIGELHTLANVADARVGTSRMPTRRAGSSSSASTCWRRRTA